MFFLKKLAYRIYQTAFRITLPFLPYREPKIIPSCEHLGDILSKKNIRCALIVTDEGILKNALVAPVEEALKKHQIGYFIYGKTQANPTVKNVEEALKVYHENSCDTLIAIGGGSAIDCAKAVGARVAYPKKTLEKMGGVMRILRKLPTLIAIPTTAGTGSETTLAAVITDENTHRKYALMSFPLIPDFAVLDARLTYTLPPRLTATTGMDALTHAVEAYIGRSTTKQTRKLALEATKLVFENVKKAYADGKDGEARENMLRAAYKAGIAFSKSYVGYIHAVAHSLGGKYGTPHGLANAVIMPHVLKAYGNRAHKKLHRLGVAAGVCEKNDGFEKGAKKFIDAIRQLNDDMQIPTTLAEIKKEDISVLAKKAAKEANPLYPVPKLMTAKELETFYYAVMEE